MEIYLPSDIVWGLDIGLWKLDGIELGFCALPLVQIFSNSTIKGISLEGTLEKS